MLRKPRRYTRVAQALHWVTAVAVLALLGTGLTMTRLDETGAAAFQLYQLHKSIGLTVLALTLARIGWRLSHTPPPLPAIMDRGERLAARTAHIGFYALLLGLPLGGWLMVSLAPLSVPTVWFARLPVPHLPVTPDEAAYLTVQTAHRLGGWLIGALVIMHVAAALGHHLILRDAVLLRMWPGRRGLAAGLGGLTVLALVIALLPPAGRARPDPDDRPVADLGTAPTNAPATAPAWTVDPERSTLGFRGRQSGRQFDGRFTRFSADIRFDPERPESGRALVVIDMASAVTGDTQKDQALPTEAWFDVARFPQARFEADSFRATGPGQFEAQGRLTLRGVSRDLALPFAFRESDGVARVTAEVQLLRTVFGIGQGQWASDGIVAFEVDVVIDLIARR